jgi:uncharacterized protein YukJ
VIVCAAATKPMPAATEQQRNELHEIMEEYEHD